MSAKIVSCVVTCFALGTAGSLTGCGFKSDLFQPDSEADNPLFQRDAQPVVEETAAVVIPSSSVEGDDIVLDKVTTVATDGRILILPDGVVREVEQDGQVTEGVPVDLTDLTRDVQRRNTQ